MSNPIQDKIESNKLLGRPRRVAPEIAAQIVEAYMAPGASCSKVATRFGVSKSTVQRIMQRAAIKGGTYHGH